MDTQTEYVKIHKAAAVRWLNIVIEVINHLGTNPTPGNDTIVMDFIEDAVRDAIQAESQQVRELDKLDMEV